MRNRVINLLFDLGIPAGCIGFKYIADAVCLMDNEEWKGVKTMAIYEKVASMNNATAYGVEKGIKTALDHAYRNAPKELFERYLNQNVRTNGNLICSIYYRLMQDEMEEQRGVTVTNIMKSKGELLCR